MKSNRKIYNLDSTILGNYPAAKCLVGILKEKESRTVGKVLHIIGQFREEMIKSKDIKDYTFKMVVMLSRKKHHLDLINKLAVDDKTKSYVKNVVGTIYKKAIKK